MKKFLLTALCSVAMGASFAMPVPYVGAGLGISVNTPNTTSLPNSGSYRGIPFSAFAGYGGIINESFYLAGEADLTVFNAEINNNGNLRSNYGFGISVLPGVMLNETTIGFVRLGVAYKTYFTNLKSSKAGGIIGAGLQTNVTQNIDFRGEYNFVAYQAGHYDGISVAPRSDVVMASIVYKFD